jgi:hypothetical protein
VAAHSSYAAVSEDVRRLERALGRRRRKLTIIFILEVGYLALTAGLVIYVNLSPSTATLIAGLGLGSLGIASSYSRIQSDVARFLDERESMADTLDEVQTEFGKCTEGDAARLAEVERLIVKAIKGLKARPNDGSGPAQG